MLYLNLHCFCCHYIDYSSQALLARGYSQGNYEQARQVVYRVLQVILIPYPFCASAILNWFHFFFPKATDIRTDPIFPCYLPSTFNQIGLATGIALAVILFLGFGAFSSLFSTDLEVLNIAWSGILVRNYKSESFTS